MIDITAPRSTEEWIGRSPDTAVPPRVRARVYLRNRGRCQICKRQLAAGDKWICDHKTAIINGGANRERNLQTICEWCDDKIKTPADVREKSQTYHTRSRHIGIRKAKGRPIVGSRASSWKQRMDGTWERRAESRR